MIDPILSSPLKSPNNTNPTQGNVDIKKNYTDLVLQLMKDYSDLQTTELSAAKSQIETIRTKIEALRKELAEERKLMESQQSYNEEASKRDEAFGCLVDILTVVAACITAVVLAMSGVGTALAVAIVALAVLQVANSRANLAGKFATDVCGVSEKDAAYVQMGVSIFLAVIGIVAGGCAASAAKTISPVLQCVQIISQVSVGTAQIMKGVSQIDLSVSQKELAETLLDKEKLELVMNYLNSLSGKNSDQMDDREKSISAIVELLMELLALLVKMVEKIAAGLEKRMAS